MSLQLLLLQAKQFLENIFQIIFSTQRTLLFGQVYIYCERMLLYLSELLIPASLAVTYLAARRSE